jgi:hypothetical protein
MATPTNLPVGSRTNISTPEQIALCGSPVHLKIQNAGQDTTIQSAFVYIWIWNGNQNKTLLAPNVILKKTKISADDNYINFQVSDYLKSYLEHPLNAPNTSQPNLVYNVLTPVVTTGQGVFWQVVVDITSTGSAVQTTFPTRFATLGWRWNGELNQFGNNGLSPNGASGFVRPVNKWYNPKIHDYFFLNFDLTKTVATATSANIIRYNAVVPPIEWSRCSQDPCLLFFINKLGLWEVFTPHGKFTAKNKVDSQIQNKSYRDPVAIDNTYTHSKLRNNIDVLQSYIINTGSLTEDMVDTIEELIYSPKVYLIKFNGRVNETLTLGITIDSTFVTIDDTNITIDSETAPTELNGFFNEFIQVPVIITNSNFDRKTRINDKNKIDYNIELEETNNKILDIR